MEQADAAVWAIAFASSLCSFFLGMAYGCRLIRADAELAVRQDHRISRTRKAAVIARIRHCPMQWVLEEMEREREAACDE